MNAKEIYTIRKALKFISTDVGLLNYITKLPRLHHDPKLISYGIWPCDTTRLGGFKYGGRSSGCGYSWDQAFLTTVGEVVERYCPAFYDAHTLVRSSYSELDGNGITPKEFALFHEKQYKQLLFPFVPFTEELEINWVPCVDLMTGDPVWYPGSLIYIPWVEDEEWIAMTSSTGLAGHTNIQNAIITGLYELIERDSFVITWMQQLEVPKIRITPDIAGFIAENFPGKYDFHFLDITFDLGVPAIFGFCFGQTEYGNFVAVGSACRSTHAEALHKVIQEIGQAVSYFRYLLGERKDWVPSDDFSELLNFEQHSLFYIKRPDLLHVFDRWKNTLPDKEIDFSARRKDSVETEIKRILGQFHRLGYNVIFKDLTTPDVRQAGFHSVRVMCPQLLQMAGCYPYYFKGGKRLYEVPAKLGYASRDFDALNKFPHPFP